MQWQELWPDAQQWEMVRQLAANFGLHLLAALLVFAALVFWIYHRLARFLRSKRGHWGRLRGLRAERKALKLLRKQGYALVEENPRINYHLLVDGRSRRFWMEPDFLVEKDGREYLVEVKRRGHRNSLGNAFIRRQVLEYVTAGKCPCLLVLMPAGEIICIEEKPES